MGDPLSPHVPPPPPSTLESNLAMLYYGLVVVGTAAIVLALYNLLLIKWCTDSSSDSREMAQRSNSNQRFDNYSVIDLVSTFKYKKGGAGKDDGSTYECAVCLSVFEEDEEVRQLPRCKHFFHSLCIDMWLHSHMDCPLCRSMVAPPVHDRAVTVQSESTREELLDPNNLV